MPRKLIVVADANEYRFQYEYRLSKNKPNRLIDQGFYDKYCNGGFTGPHIEIELYSKVWTWPHESHIHFYRTPQGRNFVCWTGQLADEEIADRIMRMWCAGTAYTCEKGEDFAPLYQNDPEVLLELLDREHRIRIRT